MNLNLNNVNKKIVLFFALVGFILSFISGLIAGSSFINLFFRSIISGLVIGLIITIINIIIMIYLPELIGASDNADSSDFDGHVNIVMPEEKYKVQTGNEDGTETLDGEEETSSDSLDSSFKEVGLDNLKSLSSSLPSGIESEVTDNTLDFTEDMSKISSSNKGADKVGEHSIEDMTKAVQTALKKD